VHVGEFLTGSKEYVPQMYKLQKSRIIIEIPLPLYHNLHQFNIITIQFLNVILVNTVQSIYNFWWDKFKSTVDDILLKFNRQTQNVY